MSKLIQTCIVAATFAVVAAPATAVAQNDATLQNHTGSVVSVGTKVAWTNTAPLIFTGVNTEALTQCEKVHIHGEVTKNEHTEIASTITSTAFSNCSTPGGASTVTTNVGNGTPWCLRSSTVGMVTHELQIRGNSCAAASRSITFIMHTPTGQCAYERANGVPIKGTYTTNVTTGAPDLHLMHQEFKRHNSTFFCAATVITDMTLDLEETVGTTDLKSINAT